MAKILLGKSKSVSSVNEDNLLGVELKQNGRVLPFNEINSSLSNYELYTTERDICNKFRLIFTINPICTNALYNMRTEVVQNEGSDSCIALVKDSDTATKPNNATNTSELTRKQAIRDTEYSHEEIGNFVYHCGLDIFNNHMLRTNSFIHVNKVSSNAETSKWNTIADYRRSRDGRDIKEVDPDDSNGITNNPTSYGGKVPHLYKLDTIMTFSEAFNQNMLLKDGWYGFTNPGFIEIPNGKNNLLVNKMMNNNKACEIYNMYPDISLYSFIPKYNKFRKRVEKNWDYCLTYPYKSDYDKFNEINENAKNCIKILTADTIYNNNGEEYLNLTSLVSHNLSTGDYIRLYYTKNNTLAAYKNRIRVIGIGNSNSKDKKHCFTIEQNEALPSIIENNTPIFFKKETNGQECEYYFRRFKKLKKNLKNNNSDFYLSVLNSEGEINYETDYEIGTGATQYQVLTNVPDGWTYNITNTTTEDETVYETDYSSEINKLAYGENIYGDRLAQIIYTDTIDLTDSEGIVLRDNLGRPLSEIYLTIAKRNAGHDKWYSNDPDRYTSSKVEFSHCFGKVTSGLELSDNTINYNVKKLHNIDKSKVNEDIVLKELWVSGTPIEDDIKIDEYETFYGDIIEFNPNTYEETVLEKVYHRVNTAQREYIPSETTGDTCLYYDDLVSDDYDSTGFNIEEKLVNAIYEDNGSTIKEIRTLGSIQPEGYYYNPHYKVKIRDIGGLNKYLGAVIIHTYLGLNPEGNNGIKISTEMDYGYVAGDSFAIYFYRTKKIVWGILSKFDGLILTIETKESLSDYTADINNKDYEIILTDGSVPEYATYLPLEETFTWRRNILPSEATTTNETYDMPFTNGCFYINTNINFFLRRQDPFNEIGLCDCYMKKYPTKDYSPLHKFKSIDLKVTLSDIGYLIKDTFDSCII